MMCLGDYLSHVVKEYGCGWMARGDLEMNYKWSYGLVDRVLEGE